MRLNVTLESKNPIILPVDYQHTIQGLIYRSISISDPEYATFLHDKGYGDDRKYKLFCFSRLYDHDSEKRKVPKYDSMYLYFGNRIKFTITSPHKKIINDIARGIGNIQILGSKAIFIAKEQYHTTTFPDDQSIGDYVIRVAGVDIFDNNIEEYMKSEVVYARTISPAVLYSTDHVTGYVTYCLPKDPRYTNMIIENIRRKYEVFNTGNPSPPMDIKVNKYRKVMCRYKDHIMECYDLYLEIWGNPLCQQFILDVGVGSKNSMGFGCLELLFNKNDTLWR